MRTILLLFFMSACAGNFERDARYAATTYVVGMTACDIGQTYAESDGGRWDVEPSPGHHLIEGNPILGPVPPPGLLATDLVLTSAVTTWIGTRAPRWVAWSYLGIVGAVETALVFEPVHVRWGGYCGVR